jgi:hypothetical protein
MSYDEDWLEHAVRGLYQAVIDEPVPKRLLEIVGRIPDRSTSDASARRWRVKAEECRTVAESMRSDSARLTLLRLARDYQALAESWDKAAQ